MAASGNLSGWEVIQQGVRDAERLIGQKQYNLSMVKARQTLEYMVNLQAEKACIVDGELIDVIDALYQGRWITKSTCEHYHKIRMIGNKAVHEGSDNAYDANQAYHLLSQEVHTFADQYSGRRRSTARNSSGNTGSSSGTRSSGSGSRSSGSRTTSRSGSGSRTSASAATRSRRRQQKKSGMISSYDLLKLLIPVLCIVLLIVVIRFIKPAGEKVEETTPPITTETEAPTETAPSDTAPQETTPASIPHKATTGVNVRKEPSTDSAKLGLIGQGTVVDVFEDPNAEWLLIHYNGENAYVHSEYVKPVTD